MTLLIENDILIQCDECIRDIKKRIEKKEPFEVKKCREETLEFIISTLYNMNNCSDTPHSCRKKITQSLLEHGQFERDEVDRIFSKRKYEYSGHEMFIFSYFDCDEKIAMGYCRIDLEFVKCPDCGNEVANVPTNLEGFENNLICKRCRLERLDEFDNRGILRFGRPVHHGKWVSQEPEFIFSGTDYFAVVHPHCEKSPNDDKRGLMLVNGLWIDRSGRIVLSLECQFCGARNALKPFKKRGEIPMMDESGGAWKYVESPILEAIKNGEGPTCEFKSSLRWDYRENRANRKLEYEVINTIASFLNSEGGMLLIGVDDNGKILGIEKDFATLGKNNKDGFQLHLTEITKRSIEIEFLGDIDIEFEGIDEKTICCVNIGRAPKPVFYRSMNGENVFAVRIGNQSPTLDPKDTTRYIETHFPATQ